MEKDQTETEFIDPEKEEQIINTDKIYDLLYFYRVPLIFAVLAVFLLGGAIFFWRQDNQKSQVIFSGVTQGAEDSQAKIKADIEGAVQKPGVYELDSGSRVGDLLILAGGLSANADREWMVKNINQAAKLVDGGKIYIPKTGGQGESGETKIAGLVSINSASISELDTLPGVGPVTAQKIIDNRPYQTSEELVSKKAVGQAVFKKIKEKISLY